MSLGFKIAAAWVGATVVAVVIASAAVGSVRSQVTDGATPLGSPDVVALAEGITSVSGTLTEPSGDGTTTSGPSPVTEVNSSTSTRPETNTPSTSVASNGSSTTSTTSATTTTATSEKYARTFDTAGGSVRVVVDGQSVTFGGAVPKTGWSIELKDPGPNEVKVEFEQNGGAGELRFSAKVEHGELKVEISGDDDD